MNSFDAEIIHAYTRKQALEDGMQVDVTATAVQVPIRFPVFLTRAVYDAYVAVPPKVIGQDEAGRLWDILWMARYGILSSPSGCEEISFTLYVRNTNGKARLVRLKAVCGPLDLDEGQPAITIMLPEED